MIAKEDLEEVVAPMLEEAGAELVEIQVVPGAQQVQLRLFVDRPAGITVGECGRLSRRIARELDLLPGLAGGYRLEVSSPGMNRPIWTLDHFRRFVGESVCVVLREPHEGRTWHKGTIASVAGECIRLRVQGDEVVELGLGDIAKAHLELDAWKGRSRVNPAGRKRGEQEV